MAACSLTLLGDLALRSAEGRDLPLTTRKDRLLLAYLALNSGRSLARDRLAGLLWGDRGETQARDSLRQSLAAIRQAFREVGLDPIESSRDSVGFNPKDIDIDAVLFQSLASDERSHGAAALSYSGALMDGIDGVTPEFETWLAPERERLASIAVHLLERMAEASPPSESAARLARQLLATDPLCEPAYRALMRLHAAAGERTAALKLYTACRDALKKELDAAPDLQTEALYRDILTARPVSTRSAQNMVQNVPTHDASTEQHGANRPSLAVLPFSNLSRDADLDHLCEGLAEDIITGLGRFRLLLVIDRYSSSMIAKQENDIAAIGRRLGVTQLVQGSLQRHGERVRITVRLLDAATRAQLWGEAYDHPIADLTNVPDAITGALISTLYACVESALLEHGRRKPKMAAYDCLLRGIKHLRGSMAEDNECAIKLFQQALDLDPDYALARAYRGFADVVANGYEDTPPEILQRARAMTQQAVAIDEQDARCQWLLGLVVGYCGDIKEKERHFRRALALNPNDANVLCTLGFTIAALGQWDEGISLIREAMRRNPYHPDWYWGDLGIVLHRAHRYEDAIEAYRRQSGHSWWIQSHLAACYVRLGHIEKAKAAAAEVIRLKPDFTVSLHGRVGWSGSEMAHFRDDLLKAGLPV